MSPEERQIRIRLRDDFLHYARVALKIKDKAGCIVPLELNRAQIYLHAEIERQRAETGKVRLIGLKGRQQGYSTYCEGRLYWRVTQGFGRTAYILTHEMPATENLFAMAQRYHEHCPELIKPKAGTANAKELAFPGLEGGYRVGTAGSKAVGRSSTVQLFHGSEVAYWPNAGTHLAGVMQAVPDAPGTEVILESTANGVGDTFHGLWQEAIAGQNDYLPVFVPWFWQLEYRKSALDFTPTDEEKELAKTYCLDHEQLAWRRSKIGELRSSDIFKQEFPCCHEEAFLSSGRKVFETNWILLAKRETYKPKYRERYHLGSEKWEQAEEGELRIWHLPVAGERYVIGADVAEGLAHGDFSSADVLDSEGYQCAQWHGHIAPDLYADVLAALGNRYHHALIGVERNNHGLVTCVKLRDAGYPFLYSQRQLDYRGSDDRETKQVGWLTTQKSKHKIIDQLAADLRDSQAGIACAETVSELQTFIIHDDGSIGAQEGCNDDRVMSRAIAGEMLIADGLATIGRAKRKAKPSKSKAPSEARF